MWVILVSIFFTSKHSCLKKWFRALFAEKVKLQAILSCIILGSIGLCFSIVYCFGVGEKDLFTNRYPSILAVVFNCSYLFVTALLEEAAWRGFLLNKLAAAKGKDIAWYLLEFFGQYGIFPCGQLEILWDLGTY